VIFKKKKSKENQEKTQRKRVDNIFPHSSSHIYLGKREEKITKKRPIFDIIFFISVQFKKK